MTDEKLVQTAKAMLEKAYAPYSGFKVGAAILGANGKTYVGCNVENSSYGATLCAERAEVGWKLHAEHRAQPERHQAVALKIEIELQAVAVHAQPRQRRRDAVQTDGVQLLPERGKLVREQHLAAQPEQKHAQSAVEIVPAQAQILCLKYAAQDRTLLQLREEAEREREVRRIAHLRAALRKHIRLTGDELEDVKADAERLKAEELAPGEKHRVADRQKQRRSHDRRRRYHLPGRRCPRRCACSARS